MKNIKKLINELDEADLMFLEENIFNDSGIIPLEEFDKILHREITSEELNDTIQFALKINLNSVYGVQIMPHFKFADEWQSLGSSTTLTGRILSKFGLIETIEQYFNPERESRFEFPLLENIIVAADDDDFFNSPEQQQLRNAVISDTDSVSGDAIVDTNLFGEISFDELKAKASTTIIENNKEYSIFDDSLKIKNFIDGNIIYDDVEYVYSHKVNKRMFEIELEDGNIIKVTEDHSIMVMDENNYPSITKSPLQLKIGDECMVLSDVD